MLDEVLRDTDTKLTGFATKAQILGGDVNAPIWTNITTSALHPSEVLWSPCVTGCVTQSKESLR